LVDNYTVGLPDNLPPTFKGMSLKLNSWARGDLPSWVFRWQREQHRSCDQEADSGVSGGFFSISPMSQNWFEGLSQLVVMACYTRQDVGIPGMAAKVVKVSEEARNNMLMIQRMPSGSSFCFCSRLFYWIYYIDCSASLSLPSADALESIWEYTQALLAFLPHLCLSQWLRTVITVITISCNPRISTISSSRHWESSKRYPCYHDYCS